ncbi:MAG: hypothetical protein COY42_27075 [Armatimonadetes bacterium CG_4_10_14_0_8_um_filter_66_14]|nr:MAG: hypothetical protein COY42_27075 [Armatimonadetes bacterium CG_4_10_14_0_8_um_filter_66_14]
MMSAAKPECAKDFVEFLRNGEFARYFPAYADRPVVPAFSSEVLNLAEVREGQEGDPGSGDTTGLRMQNAGCRLS